MIRQRLRHVLDRLLPPPSGVEARRFRELEAHARDLIHEMEAVLDKLATRAATQAKRHSRALRNEEEQQLQLPQPQEAPVEGKAAIRRRAAQRGLLTSFPRRQEDEEMSG